MAMQTFPLRNQGMEATLRRWGVFVQRTGPSWISLLLILLLAWLLAKLTWALVPSHAGTAPTPAAAPMATVRQIDAARVADRHLFGTATVQGTGNNAPDTTLALTLHGIVAGKRAADSRALIVANGDEEPYGIGAQLPGGAVIHAIYADRVLLERDGRLEALRLPKDDGSAGAISTSSGRPMSLPGRPAMAPPPQGLGQLRQEIMNNPQRLMDVVRAMPVMDHGKLTGYRVYPAGNPSTFNQIGLRAGDVVTAVNGIPLTDPAQSMRVLSSLKTSEQVSISLLRNGQQQTQVLQMPPQGSEPVNMAQPSPPSNDDDNNDDENPP